MNYWTNRYKFLGLLVTAFLAAGCGQAGSPIIQNTANNQQASTATSAPSSTPQANQAATAQVPADLALPIKDALSRVSKKPFGLYVTPKNSPVQPERFTGYHTGADFETTPQEQNIDVPIFALCDGTIKVARHASGYGGVMVEACTINNEAVTVIYGHIRLSSVTVKVGQTVKAGDELAVLGTGYSQETDGERKHLHLGIHKGISINILGYVQNKADLAGWLDPLSILK